MLKLVPRTSPRAEFYQPIVANSAVMNRNMPLV
jgi:hypothetical protein